MNQYGSGFNKIKRENFGAKIDKGWWNYRMNLCWHKDTDET